MSNDILTPLHILLVEDSVANQRFVMAMLAGSEHTCVAVENGSDALAQLQTTHFDVVLMDVQMPVMDGLEATAAIREAEKDTGKHLPIIGMTAQGPTSHRAVCIQAGMDEYIAKPIRRQELVEKLTVVLRESSLTPGSNVEIDWSGPLDELAGDVGMLAEITTAYLTETIANLAKLPVCIAEKNATEAHRLSHSIKGAMRFFGASTAQSYGQKLEDLCAKADLASAQECYERLESEVQKVLPILRRFIEVGEM